MLKIGIIGCGGIAEKLAATMIKMDQIIKIEAVASRSLEKAEAFASRFAVEKAYGSYDELYDDEAVELVYVATPHAFHHRDIINALRKGKNILAEKAFCINEKEAEEVFQLAAEKNLYVAEAIWTRYMPSRKIINDIIASGRIGRVTSISANLGYKIMHKPRLQEPSLGGGALLDIGVYPLNFVLMATEGDVIEKISGIATKSEKNVDVRNSIILKFKSGVVASIFSDAECVSDRRGIIYGTEGTIIVENVNNPAEIKILSGVRNPVLLETIPIAHRINGYEYELEAAADAIANGKREPDAMPWHETLRVLRIADTLRSLWGIKLGEELQE